ncbi:hypothetical protein GO003_011335 [Methylicorpusculum oleiharenae]|uniref:hypothetical protein n=1 Tax=Methylicorpusculum oleiharenae TaxID=1338687 RepID=UPI0013DE26C0|nr:hypothetical protein [Methylicorpusculum oleiharenae]MCD2450987.1 hypothetical protein [Methylicorpusculum oleiharenae]
MLENFDEDIHDLLKLQLDQAEQRLDKISRWFWAVTQHQLKSYAQIDDQLKLQRFSIDALDRSEDLLLFAAVTETGQVLPAETVQKNHAMSGISLHTKLR